MNYIDRKSIALERFFAKRSEMLSHLDDFTEEALREAVSELFPLKRLMLAVIARDSLRYLREKYELSEYIPEDILASAEMSVRKFIQGGHFTNFLLWLRSIHLRNAQARIPWETSLKTAASRLKAPADSFFRSFLALSNQRVFITLDDDTMTITPAEREWGRTAMHFYGCRFNEQPPMPLPGFAIAAEADLSDRERIGLSILIDTRFGEVTNDFSDRLLSDEGWQTVSFSCSDISLEAAFTDYVGHMRRCGASKSEVVFDTCRIILNKRLLIGADGLNSRERSMMPVAALIGALDSLNSKQPADFAEWQYEDIILDTLSNRCVIQDFISTLRKYGCDDLALFLEKAAQESYDEHEAEALRFAKIFGAGFLKKLADGTLRPLLHYLFGQFSEMSAHNADLTDRLRAEQMLLEQLSKKVSPEMDKLGFSGQFPDFRRINSDKMEYISFMLERRSDRINKGIVTYSAAIAAAEISTNRLEDYKKYGVPADETTALDCMPESFDTSNFGELCDHHDGGPAIFDLDFYSGEEILISHDDSNRLTSYLACAEHQFKTGRLPSGYHRRIPLTVLGGTFARSFGHCLPLSLIVTIVMLAVYLLVGEKLFPQPLSRQIAAAIALGAGLIFNCIAGTVRCIMCSRKLWRY